MNPNAGDTLGTVLQHASARLAHALALARAEARLEAQMLVAHALQVPRAWLIAHDRDPLTPAQGAAVQRAIARRASGEPVAYILGEREFYGRRFRVGAEVLIPRPETERLVEAGLTHLPAAQPASVLDLGTGSGCIAITLALERPAWQVWGVDISSQALKIAQANAATLHATVHWQRSDLFAGLPAVQRFDLIVSNPPYVADTDPHLGRGDVRHEPRLALAGGARGMAVLAALIRAAPARLAPQGWLMLEHGWDQGDNCRDLMAQSGFMNPHTLPDLAGHPRVSLARLPA